MFDIIIKAAGFVFIIILGMFSRKIGLLKKEDSFVLSKIIVTFTLPCALISGFGGITFSLLTLITLLLGFLCNAFLLTTGKFLARKQTPLEKANAMICTSGYNIGAFVVPFCQSFFSPEILSYIIMFDIGNCIMCLGGSSAIARFEVDENSKFSVMAIVKKLSRSVSFDVYMFLILISLFNLKIPDPCMTIISMIGEANVFIIMFMIGMQIELSFSLHSLASVSKIIFVRYGFAILFALAVQMLPIDPACKTALTVVVFAPLSSVTTIFSQELGCDTNVAALAGSLSMPISVCAFVVLLIFLA
ncbi:MAG TPA: hypothetical protein IAA17_01495 [Candidatus Lachnoclostridium stercorigallinarum]|uniref:Transporter n=1 Tax=Candidatus Lachnoclostridium stercorigallinarum TaxID=2838634 RepID=A0A9D2K463_9FIRM|nr:hypothetical protein [Candidatus Lachnoclostridium stercorigallinarum]